MEEKDNFLHKMSDVLSIFSPYKYCPIMGVSLRSRLFAPSCRMSKNQFYLNWLLDGMKGGWD